MKLTNGEIFVAREPLAKLMEQRFPVMVSYKLAKLASALNDQLKVIDETRNKLIKDYGTPDKDNTQQISVRPDSDGFAKFAEEFAELMATEVELDIAKVKLPEKVAATCDACHHNMDKMLEIEPGTLLLLDKFIEV